MIAYIVLLMAWVWAEDVQQSGLSLYIEEALVQNLTLEAQRMQIEANREGVFQAQYLPAPTINVAGFVQPIETKVGPQRMKIGIQQSLPWFGTRSLQQEHAVNTVIQAEQKLIELERQLILDLKKIWFPMVELEQRISVLKAHRDIVQTVEQIASRRLESGRGSMVDLIRLDIQHQEIDVEIEIAHQELKMLKVAFNLLGNADRERDVVIETTEQPFSSMQNDVGHPTLEQLDTEIVQLNIEQQLVEKHFYPRIGLGLDYIVVGAVETVGTSGQDAIMPMISVQLPTYRSKVRSELAEVDYKRQRLLLQREAQIQQFQIAVSRAVFVQTRGEQQLKLYREQLRKTEQSMELLLRAYTTDDADFEEILALEQQMLTYQRNILTTKKDIDTALAEQEWLQGGWSVQ